MSIKKETPVQLYSSGEKVLCFHGPLLYEAKCLDVKTDDDEVKYFVHYQGWNKNWDEWVTDRRMYKYDETGLRKQKELEKLAKSGKKLKILRKSDLKNQPYPPPEIIEKVEKAIHPDESSKEDTPSVSKLSTEPLPEPEQKPNTAKDNKLKVDVSEPETPKIPIPTSVLEEKSTRSASTPANNRKRKGRPGISDAIGEQEESSVLRPRIQVKFPGNLRAWLVDDWDLITKQSRLFDLPARKTVNSILDDYIGQLVVEKTDTTSTEGIITLSSDLRQEFATGLRINFNFILGSQLLYKFERLQYADILKKHAGKSMADIYGPMHLLRLLVKLRDLLTFTKADQTSVAILESVIADFIGFLDRNQADFFRLEDYTVVTADYLRLAMC